MNEAAGTLLYQRGEDGLDVLLVHPSGNYNRRAAWSIPKGKPEAGETLEQAARRETREETGVVAGPLVPLGFVDYTKSRKRVHAFAGACEGSAPCCASWEVDQAEFVPIVRARELLHADQVQLLDRLERLLDG